MSVFDTAYTDSLSIAPEQAATGPRVGFMDSFENSLNSQKRTATSYGLENDYRDAEYDQARTLHKAGAQDIPAIDPGTIRAATDSWGIDPVNGPIATGDNFKSYSDAAHFIVNGGTPEQASRMDAYDKRIDDLSKQYPDLKLKNSRDLFADVSSKAREAIQADAQRKTMGGKVGSFLGGTAGSLDFERNPIGVASLALGGIGKSVVTRIGVQAAGQGAAQALNEITGVAENRRLLGVEDAGGSAGRIIEAAAGGALMQGAGEALHAGVKFGLKRWFADAPGDPAPPHPDAQQLLLEDMRGRPMQGQEAAPGGTQPQEPWAKDITDWQDQNVRDLMNGTKTVNDIMYPADDSVGGRMGKARSILDTDYTASQLEPFDGPNPWEIPPPTSTSIPKRVGADVAPDINVDIHKPGGNVDEMARQVDPKTFSMFDELAQQKATYKRWLDDMQSNQMVKNAPKTQGLIDDLSDKIDAIHETLNTGRQDGRTINNTKKATLQSQLEGLMTERQGHVDKLQGKYSNEMKVIHQKLMDADYKMRDLSPMVTRAYNYAKNQWEGGAADREAIASMIRDGRTELPDQRPILNDTYENTMARFDESLTDRAPILRDADKVEAQMRPHADAADYAQAIIKEHGKIMDDALDAYRSSLDKIINQKTGEIELNGQTYKLDLTKDKIFIPHEEGDGGREVSIRELLKDNAKTEDELKAVQTCSVL